MSQKGLVTLRERLTESFPEGADRMEEKP